MTKKKIWQFIIIGGTFGIIFFFQLQDYFDRERFFGSEINSTIIEIKGNWSGGRSYDYITKNKVVINLINSDSTNLKLKDSIVKQKDSWKFIAFRLNDLGVYEFFKKYETK